MAAAEPCLEICDLAITILTRGAVLRPVRGVDLTVHRGEIFCVVGESGCGKSLTAMAAPGLLPPAARVTSGRISLGGVDLLRLARRQLEDIRGRDIGVVFQDPMSALNPTMTIGAQLMEVYLRHVSRDRKAARERAIALLREVGIADAEQRLSRYPHELSGGLRQRVMIAMAMMTRPRLLICDEATTALDVTVQRQVLDLLRGLQRDHGVALMFITHDLGVVAAIADRVAVLYAGEVIEMGPAAQILAAPQHPYTRALLACAPQIDAVALRAGRVPELGAIPGHLPDLTQPVAGCAFAPRCARAGDLCHARRPRRDLRGGREVRCHFPEVPQ